MAIITWLSLLNQVARAKDYARVVLREKLF